MSNPDIKDLQLKNLIIKLSKEPIRSDENLYNSIIKELYTLYCNENYIVTYRHRYSIIQSALFTIHQEQRHGQGSLELIIENINYIHTSYTSKGKVDLTIQIAKLYDFINLENTRLEYSHKENKSIETNVKNMNDKVNDVQEEVSAAKKDIDESKEELKNSKYDIVAIISLVFSAFTLLGVNTAIISGLFSIESKIMITMEEAILLFSTANATLIAGIVIIFSMIKYIITKDNKDYKSFLIIVGISVVVVVGLFGIIK